MLLQHIMLVVTSYITGRMEYLIDLHKRILVPRNGPIYYKWTTIDISR
jgi:hypothetical protein